MDYIISILILYLSSKILLDLMQLYTVKKAVIDTNIIHMLSVSDNDISLSRNYNIDKLKLSVARNIIYVLLIYVLLYGDVFKSINSYIYSYDLNDYLSNLFIILLTYLYFNFSLLPLSYYSTFIIEEKYGFNNSSKSLFLRDTIISSIVALVIITFLSVSFFFITDYSDSWWLLMSFTIFLFIVISIYIYPTYISPIFNKFKKLNDDSIINEIDDLSTSTDFNIANLYVMDMSKRSKHPNAYFTGFKNNRRIVFYDTLLEILNPSEIKAVLAHEIGHYKLNHISKSLLLTVVSIFVGMYFLSNLIDNNHYLTMLNMPFDSSSKLIALVLSYQIISFFINPLFSIFSRKNEYEADAYAAEKVESKYLITSLVKLYKSNLTFLIPNKIYASIYYSHPTVLERISKLRGYND